MEKNPTQEQPGSGCGIHPCRQPRCLQPAARQLPATHSHTAWHCHHTASHSSRAHRLPVSPSATVPWHQCQHPMPTLLSPTVTSHPMVTVADPARSSEAQLPPTGSASKLHLKPLCADGTWRRRGGSFGSIKSAVLRANAL